MLSEIYNQDCFEFIKNLPDKSIDLLFTDPPYKMQCKGKGLVKNKVLYQKLEKYGANPNVNYEELLQIVKQKLKTINMFFFCDKTLKFDLLKFAVENDYSYKELAFCKTSPVPFSNNQWHADIEWGIHIFKGLKVMGDYNTKKSFFIMPNFREKGIAHPTPKKVSVIKKILQNITEKGDVVLDLFLGSGTTAVACEEMGRKCIGCEIDKEYYDLAVDRLRQLDSQAELFNQETCK